MRYLLDTHVFLWANATPEKLNAETRELFDSSDAVLYFSAISAYEIALKVNLGKLRLPQAASVYITERISDLALIALPIQMHHAAEAGALPTQHRDPFDRILAAQARSEKLTIVTADPALATLGARVHQAS